MEKVASSFIRNTASLAGNLVMGQRKCFPSDIATLLLAVGLSICILSGHTQERIAFEEFLHRPTLDLKDVLMAIRIPFLEPTTVNASVQNKVQVFFETYHAAPHPTVFTWFLVLMGQSMHPGRRK